MKAAQLAPFLPPNNAPGGPIRFADVSDSVGFADIVSGGNTHGVGLAFADLDGQGEILLGETEVRADGSWFIPALLPAPLPRLTVTVTSAVDGSTSEFTAAGMPSRLLTISRTGEPQPGPITAPGSGAPFAVLPLTLAATGDAVLVHALTFQAEGTLADDSALATIALYRDGDANGRPSAGDTLLGQTPAFENDDGQATIPLGGVPLDAGSPQPWLLVYQLKQPVTEGATFRVRLVSAGAVEATFLLPVGLSAPVEGSFPILSDPFVVGPPATSGFADWRRQHFPTQSDDDAVSGPAADPDEDALPNLWEYAAGTNPNAAEGVSPVRMHLEQGRFVVEFRRLKAATGVSFQAEASTDLLTWTSGLPRLEASPTLVDAGDYEQVQFRSAQTIAELDRLFVRFALTLDAPANP